MKSKTVNVLLICLANLCLAARAAAYEWPTYQANARHTGHVPVTLNTSLFTEKWTASFPDKLNPVTAADGKVFVSRYIYFDSGQQFWTLDASDGTTKWWKDFGRIHSVDPPAYAYGNVYIQTGNHTPGTYLRAYNAETGALVFRSPHAAQWERYYAPTIYDGHVYINGGYYGGMYSFNAMTGVQDWFIGLPQYDQWTPAVDENYAYAYVGEYSPGLYVVDRRTGVLAFKISDPNFDWGGWSMRLAPVLGAHDNVIAIQDGRLISFDVANRKIGWEIDGSFTGQAVLADGVIYSIDAGVLSARDEQTGAPLWVWEIANKSLLGELFVTDNLAFVRTSNSTHAVDLGLRQEAWSYPKGGYMTLSENTLYLAGADGVLTAITVPEPATLSLLAFGGLAALRRRRPR